MQGALIFALPPKIDPSPFRDDERCGCEISRRPPRKPQLTAKSSCRARRGPGPPSPPGTHGSSAAPAPTCPAPLPGAPPAAAPRPGQPQGTVRPRCGRGVRGARAKGGAQGGEGGSGRRSQTRPWRRRRKRCSCGGREGWERRKEGEGWVRTGTGGAELSQCQQVFQGDRCPRLHARGSPVAIAGSGRPGIGDGGRDAGTGREGRKRRGWQKDETYVLPAPALCRAATSPLGCSPPSKFVLRARGAKAAKLPHKKKK